MLRCPKCGDGRLPDPVPSPPEVKCARCNAAFPLRDGVIDLLPDRPARGRSLAQATMESGFVVRIYESRLWRRSPLFALATRLSFARELELILGAARLAGARRVLDLACGPGIIARPLARALPEGRVIGLDLSLPMLRHARREARAQGLDNLILVRGDALDLPVPDASLDAVVCSGAFHLFPDPPRVLQEIRRGLTSGGRLVLAVFRRGEGRLADMRDRARRRLYGVASFSRIQLDFMLKDADLGDVQFHHDAGLWLIVSALRPPV